MTESLPYRFVLITYAQGAGSIKVDKFHPGFVNQQLFLKELGNLDATDLGRPGETLKTAFELVNMDRLQNFIDTFAQVRPRVTARRLYPGSPPQFGNTCGIAHISSSPVDDWGWPDPRRAGTRATPSTRSSSPSRIAGRRS